MGCLILNYMMVLYFQLKKGNEFRPNSDFEVYTGAINITNQITEKTSWNLQYTKLYYLAQQPGGLQIKSFMKTPINLKELETGLK